MSNFRKNASVGLALLLAATAVAGGSPCPQELSSAKLSGIEMSAMLMPGMNFSRLGLGEARTKLCCQVSVAELPKPAFQASPGGSGPTLAVSGYTSIHADGTAKANSFNAQARTAAPHPQAFLCVFLI